MEFAVVAGIWAVPRTLKGLLEPAQVFAGAYLLDEGQAGVSRVANDGEEAADLVDHRVCRVVDADVGLCSAQLLEAFEKVRSSCCAV